MKTDGYLSNDYDGHGAAPSRGVKGPHSTGSEKRSEEDLWRESIQLALHNLKGSLSSKGVFAGMTLDDFCGCIDAVGREYPQKLVRTILIHYLIPMDANGEISEETGTENEQKFVPLPGQILSIVEAVSRYVFKMKDSEFMSLEEKGQSVKDHVLQALHQLWGPHRDADTGLLKNFGNSDSTEVVPEHRNLGRTCCSAYTNLRAYRVLGLFLRILAKSDPAYGIWSKRKQELGTSILSQFWMETKKKWVGHVYPVTEDSVNCIDELDMFLPHTTAMSLVLDLLNDEQKASCLEQLKQVMFADDGSTFGLAVYPPYPEKYFSAGLEQGWVQVLGAEHVRSCVETAGYLREAGESDLAETIFRKIALRALEDGSFFEWYTSDHCPQGKGPNRSAAGSFYAHCFHLHPQVKTKVPDADDDKSFPNKTKTKSSSSRRFGNKHIKHSFKKIAYSEKRSVRRLALNIPSEFIVRGHGHKWLMGNIRYPSQIGLSLHTSMEVPVGALVKIRARNDQLGPDKLCRLRGRVVWSQAGVSNTNFSCGIELDARSTHLKRWQKFIDHRLSFSRVVNRFSLFESIKE